MYGRGVLRQLPSEPEPEPMLEPELEGGAEGGVCPVGLSAAGGAVGEATWTGWGWVTYEVRGRVHRLFHEAALELWDVSKSMLWERHDQTGQWQYRAHNHPATNA